MRAGAELVEDFSALITGSSISWAGPWKQRPLNGSPFTTFSISSDHSAAERSLEWEILFPDSHGVLDLGNVILFPGLVNAHAHLEYTHLAGLHPSTSRFTEWIQWIVRAKQSWTEEAYANSWRAGAAQSLKHGCLWIADHQSHWQESFTGAPAVCSQGWLLPNIMTFLEYIDFNPANSAFPAFADRLMGWINLLQSQTRKRSTGNTRQTLQRVGISPHAPYTTVADGLKKLATLAAKAQVQSSIHVAESKEEMEMFLDGTGPLAEMMQRLGRPSESRSQTPLAFLYETGILHANTLLAHANHLSEDDWTILKRQLCSVVHTPRCHSYFQRDRFPIEKFTAAGVPVSIGTDSLASIERGAGEDTELDLKAEARKFLRQHPGESNLKTLQRLTTIPAKALGLERVAGEIGPATFADLAWIPADALIKNICAETAAACLLNFQGPVSGIVRSGLPFVRRECLNVQDEAVNQQ